MVKVTKEGTGSIGVSAGEGVVEGGMVEVKTGVESCGGALGVGVAAGPHPPIAASDIASSASVKASAA